MNIQQLIYAIKKPYHFIKTGILNGLPAQLYFQFPQRNLTIITITGTDGKTTSANMLYHVLQTAGIQTALLSTVNARVGTESIDTGFHVTSPQPWQLYAFMKKITTQGVTHLILEVTSHGSYQYRDWGITSEISGVTNIAHEHLDYHGTYEEYVKAKAQILNKAKVALINKRDQSYNTLRKYLTQARVKTYNREESEDTLDAAIVSAYKKKFPERYNQLNAQLVAYLALELSLDPQDIARGLARFPGVPGRMEHIPNKLGLTIIVDFAHTPQGVEAALRSVTENAAGKVHAVLGSAGLRDTKKRPVMGKLAAHIADSVIFTAEDPRVENVWSIIHQMKSDLGDRHSRVRSIADRKQAIRTAIQTAQTGDTVIVLGKGHEQSMCFGTEEHNWSDAQAIRDILAEQ